ncbi:MAG: helix-turn-helix domain-containing protein [Treponema sp.]|jgi:transposase|nr:helix-turn-helix domain-containing protein [Treponema sp.]
MYEKIGENKIVKIQRAFKVRLYPTTEQRVCLNKTLGSCRFLYNLMLAERIETYQTLKDNREALYGPYVQNREGLQTGTWVSQRSRRGGIATSAAQS